jgi:peroxiredoxin
MASDVWLELFFIDFLWAAPFSLILLKAYASRRGVLRKVSPAVQEMALRSRTNKGFTLLEMSTQQPILAVFLRHFGCPLCRETLSDLSKQRKELERIGTQIVLIHMSSDQRAHDVFLFYGLADLPRVTDSSKLLYRAFGLRHGGLLDLFGPR